MKRSLVLLLALIALSSTSHLFAQTMKFAHIDRNALIQAMPATDSAQNKLKAYEQEIVGQMESLQVEMNKKYQEYLQKRESLTPALKEAKEKELTEMQQRLQDFQMAAQKDFQDMQGKLMQPIMEKAAKAIEKAGKEGGYLYVFDTSLGAVIYHSEQSTDLLPVVKKALGIKK